MRIKAISPNFIMPTKGTQGAGAFDIYMPEAGRVFGAIPQVFGLGFAGEVPENHIALIVPRSGIGAKFGIELNNTCGVIDSDYRGEWLATIRTKSGNGFEWCQHDRLLQFAIVPIKDVSLELVQELSDTDRGSGGFGSSGR